MVFRSQEGYIPIPWYMVKFSNFTKVERRRRYTRSSGTVGVNCLVMIVLIYSSNIALSSINIPQKICGHIKE